MKFFGTGNVWDARKNKVLVEFKDGVVETQDPYICSVLKDQGFKYEGRMEAELDEKTKQLNELKTKVKDLEKSADPKALNELRLQIEKSEEKIKLLEEELAENKRSADIIREKIVDLGLAKAKDIKDIGLLDLCEIFISKLQGAEEPEDKKGAKKK
jgi:predicted RNase H-like nuclease (RuvC/YqgF family)